MDEVETDLTPKAAAFIAALHATRGDPEAAGQWMMELIAWLVFRRHPFNATSSSQEQPSALACV